MAPGLWTTPVGGSCVHDAARVSAHRRLLPGVFVGSAAIGEGLLTRGQLRRRSYRRLTQGVYADPGGCPSTTGSAARASHS
ncbi:hypothetical protein [Geodermatophilus sp. SYSU D00700]